MDRGVPLFVLGVSIMAVELVVMFFTSDRAALQALGLKGLGLVTPIGVLLCVLSGPVGRRRPPEAA